MLISTYYVSVNKNSIKQSLAYIMKHCMYNDKAPFAPIVGCYRLGQVVIIIVSNTSCIFSEIITLFNIASTMRFSKEKAHKHRTGIQLIESWKAVGLLTINGRVGQDNGKRGFHPGWYYGPEHSWLHDLEPWVIVNNPWLYDWDQIFLIWTLWVVNKDSLQVL